MVAVLIGHATFCALAKHATMSTFNAVYKFIQVAGDDRIPVWSAVRRELRAFARLMMFFRGEWSETWSSTVTSFDACLTGWGVTEGEFDADMIGRLGRTPERSRFRKLPLSTTA